MALRFEAEELDEDTLSYLRLAREQEGEGVPAVYLTAPEAVIGGTWLPIVGAIVGFFLILFTLLLTFGSESNPNKVSLLMTAGLLLGGWLIVAFLRSLIARQRSDYIGYFKLIDPLYVWEGKGRGVEVTLLDGLRSARVEHNHGNDGGYFSFVVCVKLGDEVLDVTVKGMARAEQVMAFLEACAELREMAPLERGYQAREIADEDEDVMLDRLDALARGEPPPAGKGRQGSRGRDVEELPEPHKVRSALTWWPYPVLVIVGVLLFLLCKLVAGVRRDDNLYDEATRPANLRYYLLDQRNTRHRPEAQAKLDAFHESAAQRVRNIGGGNAELKHGFADIIAGLKKVHSTPVVTIGFRGKLQPVNGQEPAFATDRQKQRQKTVSKALADHLVKVLGDPDQGGFWDTAAYADVADADPALIDVAFTGEPVQENFSNAYRIRWVVTLRPEPGERGRVWQVDTKHPYLPQAFNSMEGTLNMLHTQFTDAFKNNLPAPANFPGMPFMPPGFPR